VLLEPINENLYFCINRDKEIKQSCWNVPFVETLFNIEMAQQTAKRDENRKKADAMDLGECVDFLDERNIDIPNLSNVQEMRDKVYSILNLETPPEESGQNINTDTVSIKIWILILIIKIVQIRVQK